MPESDLYRGRYADLVSRGIREETCRRMNYVVIDPETGGKFAQVANYCAPGKRKVIAQKVRLANKEFAWRGDASQVGLFGEQVWEAGGKRLVITEGEIDALSYAQVTNLSWPVVSVPNGAQGAAKAIRRSLEFIESFEEVVFLFDHDEPGRQAAVECADLLSPGKAKIATLPLKDANEMLTGGRIDELRKSVYQAKTYRPDGVVSGSDIDLHTLQTATQPGYRVPYLELDAVLHGFRKRELVMICAGSGIGKSTLARELAYCLLTDHNLKVGWIMLEESLTRSAQALVAMDNNIPVGSLMENPAQLSDEQWQASLTHTLTSSAFYDSWGSTEIDNLISKMRYLTVGCQVDFIILDHVSMVVSGLETENERKSLDILMTNLRKCIEQTGVGVIAVSHVKRNGSKESFNEGGKISLTDLRGSAAIEQLSDAVIAVERDQQSDDDGNTATLRVLKNRTFGTVGHAGYARFVPDTGRLVPYDPLMDAKPEPDIPF